MQDFCGEQGQYLIQFNELEKNYNETTSWRV